LRARWKASKVKLAAQSTSGSIVGIVQDATGAVMPQVTVKIKNLSDNTMRATLTDTAGEYHLLNLKPGSYEIVASKENFVNSIVSSIGLTHASMDLKLDLAGVRRALPSKPRGRQSTRRTP